MINLDDQEVAPGKQNVRAACPKFKLEFKCLSTPLNLTSLLDRNVLR